VYHATMKTSWTRTRDTVEKTRVLTLLVLVLVFLKTLIHMQEYEKRIFSSSDSTQRSRFSLFCILSFLCPLGKSKTEKKKKKKSEKYENAYLLINKLEKKTTLIFFVFSRFFFLPFLHLVRAKFSSLQLENGFFFFLFLLFLHSLSFKNILAG